MNYTYHKLKCNLCRDVMNKHCCGYVIELFLSPHKLIMVYGRTMMECIEHATKVQILWDTSHLPIINFDD